MSKEFDIRGRDKKWWRPYAKKCVESNDHNIENEVSIGTLSVMFKREICCKFGPTREVQDALNLNDKTVSKIIFLAHNLQAIYLHSSV